MYQSIAQSAALSSQLITTLTCFPPPHYVNTDFANQQMEQDQYWPEAQKGKSSIWRTLLINYFCHTRAPSWILSQAENLASVSLQDGATKWYYFLVWTTHPPPTHS